MLAYESLSARSAFYENGQRYICFEGPNIEFSCAAESLGRDGSVEQSSVSKTESKASAATICYVHPERDMAGPKAVGLLA
jgi:hypothetical protein